MRLRGKQLDAINAALKGGTAEDFNAALQKTCAQAEGIGQFAAAPGLSHPVNTLTCVYCGHQYPKGTPPHGAQVLTDHIKICDKHPMRKLEQDNVKLRKALVGLVGADTPKELEGMEALIRTMPVPDEDRMNTINAIHALRDTAVA